VPRAPRPIIRSMTASRRAWPGDAACEAGACPAIEADASARMPAACSRLMPVILHRSEPYLYGIIGCMKKTLHVDDDLLRDARAACGARTDTDTVRLGLEALVRHGAYERLRALRGADPGARDTRRERARVPRKRSAA